MSKFKVFFWGFLAVTAASINLAYADTIVNQTPFYLNLKSSGGNCPQQIAPGQSAQISGYCGYIACATSQHDGEGNCEELKGDGTTSLTPGGYLSYLGISSAAKQCTIGANWFPYLCSIDSSTGNLSINYKTLTQVYSAGPKAGQAVTLPKVSTYNSGVQFRGVNISGLEYDGTFLDALYQHPDLPDMQYFTAQGMNTVRLPVRWEYLVSSSANAVESHDPMSSTINTMYLNAVYDTVQKYLSSGLNVDLDLHNYMRFCTTGAAIGQGNEPTNAGMAGNQCQLVTANQLAYIWDIIATKFAPLAKQYPQQLIFELMNEPFSMDGTANQQLNIEDLFKAEVVAVKAIREQGLSNLILLSGDYWDPLHGWVNQSPSSGDLPNGVVFTAANLASAGLSDLTNIALDMHQYFDANWSGTHSTCQQFTSYADFTQKLALTDAQGNDIFGNWLRANGMKVFLGEFGAAVNPTCEQDMNYMLQYVNEHAYDAQNPAKGGFIGWTTWRANKHGYTGFGDFNFLQAEDDNVYGGNGTPQYLQGLGIAPGQGNNLMKDVLAKYLQPTK
jgi:endoglucanase